MRKRDENGWNLCREIQKRRGVQDTHTHIKAPSKENWIWSCSWDLTTDCIRSIPIIVDHWMHVPRPFGFLSKDIIPKVLSKTDAKDLAKTKGEGLAAEQEREWSTCRTARITTTMATGRMCRSNHWDALGRHPSVKIVCVPPEASRVP